MKKQIISILLLLTLTTYLNASNSITEEEDKIVKVVDKTLIVNLDKNLTKETRGAIDTFIDIPLEMIDINVISFIGDVLQKKLPISITIGDNDEVKFKKLEFEKSNSFTIDKNRLKIKLKDGDYIRMKDKDGKLFFQGKIVTD